MRTNSGNYTFQQALTIESSSIVRQALNLAKRRGHSHVTPLHVASAMLVSSSSALLRKACLQTHSHPLQYKALEFCFNVALNRLPTSASSSILEPRVHPPCLSNALVAAFKRAQANQRRGSIENQQQQQHLKVEIEQLVISILDDPSVSRVMSEAGFSSIQLKINVEHAISSENSTKLMIIAPADNLKLSLCKSGDDPSVRRVMREGDFSSFQLKTKVEHAIASEISCKNRAKSMVISPNNLKLSLCKSSDGQIKIDDDVMKCKTGCPSLQTLWDLHPIAVPAVNLDLSLNLERTRTTLDGSTVKTESTTSNSSPSLPSWLQKYKEVNKQDNKNIQEPEEMRNFCQKWNSICNSFHKHDHNFLSSSSPFSSTSVSSSNQSKKEHQFLNRKPELLSNPNSSPNSTSSSEANGYMEYLDRFKEFDSPKMLPHSCQILQKCTTSGGSDMHPSTFLNNSSNIRILCNALEKKVPWQKDIIPDIVSTILECRHKKKETWLLFLGADSQGKEKISRELAKIIFGSQDSFISIGLSTFSSSTRTDSSDHQEVSNKRSRDERGRSYLERFADAIQENPSRVFFMEDVDQVDSFSQKGIQKAIETRKLTLPIGDLVFVKDSIVIFICEELSCANSSLLIPHPCQIRQKHTTFEKSNTQPLTFLKIPSSIGDFGIFEAVDKQIMFKIQDKM